MRYVFCHLDRISKIAHRNLEQIRKECIDHVIQFVYAFGPPEIRGDSLKQRITLSAYDFGVNGYLPLSPSDYKASARRSAGTSSSTRKDIAYVGIRTK